MQSRSSRISLLALLLVAGSCAADTSVSTTGEVPVGSSVAASTTVTSVPEPVTPTSSITASSTTMSSMSLPAQECVTDAARDGSMLVLPAGFEIPPVGTEFVGGQARQSVFQLAWDLPRSEEHTSELQSH